jgi:hypothetical protein
MQDSEIPEAGNQRFNIRIGGRIGLVRFHPENDPTRGWQIDVSVGFSGQFDIDSSLDAIGWDGLYALSATYKPSSDLGFRFGGRHDSAHVGDEYAEKTGRERIRYTREELAIGVSWAPTKPWRIYGEGGWAYTLRNDQERWRLQTGLEYFSPSRFWSDAFSWYSALDVNFFQERGWNPATTFQVGLVLPSGRGTLRYRIALEYYHGRSQMGEFSFYDESYFAAGIYADF